MPNAFKALKTLHFALFTGMTMFAVISLVVRMNGFSSATGESFERTFQVVCVIVSAACLFTGFNIFKRKILAARNSIAPGEQRMDLYRAACIMWWALVEGPGLLATVGYLLTGNEAFLALAIFHIVILLAFMPRKQNIILLLNLNAAEVRQLEGNV